MSLSSEEEVRVREEAPKRLPLVVEWFSGA